MRLFCLVCLIWLQGTLWGDLRPAGKIEALIVVDLQDERIGCIHDVENVRKSLLVIGEKIGFEVSTTTLKSRGFVASTVVQKLKKLPSSKDNIVVFYYSGHGFHDKNRTSRWPTLFTKKQRLAGSAIVKYLKRRSSRSSIVIFDCCNSSCDMKKIVHSIRSVERLALSHRDNLEGLASLFLETKGVVVMAAAQVGEAAEGTISGGGVFTGALLRSMKKFGDKENPTWDSIFQDAANQTNANSSYRSQHPIFAVEPDRG